MSDCATELNADCRAGLLDGEKLKEALQAQGEDFYSYVTANCPHLFADIICFVSASHMAQMRAVIDAVHQVTNTLAWEEKLLPGQQEAKALGAFMGYDFHLNVDGAHLIEINTNAGGAYLNELLLRSQQGIEMPGETISRENLDQVFLDMFRNEWQLERGDKPLRTVAIMDEQPQQQYLYPEFLLAQRVFEQAGLKVLIADPSDLEFHDDGVYCNNSRVDMIYNRLTDFLLEQHGNLKTAWQKQQVVLTPDPLVYARYADKRNLALLSDADVLREMGVTQDVIDTLLSGIPQVRLVDGADHEQWWSERKQWFFKPATGYGAKGSYRGANVTRRVFDEIMQGGYVAQRLAVPGERMLCADGAEPAPYKVDVRCYVYAGEMQLVVARLYQGQTTNFRTPGGGFAPVRIV